MTAWPPARRCARPSRQSESSDPSGSSLPYLSARARHASSCSRRLTRSYALRRPRPSRPWACGIANSRNRPTTKFTASSSRLARTMNMQRIEEDPQRVADALRPHLLPDPEHDAVVRLVGKSRFALFGEASHGTREFYRERIRITQRLIVEQGFTAVAVEADWPDAYRVNRYVRGMSRDRDANEALSGFQRFPSWMWRNSEVRGFVEWLRDFNADRPAHKRVGFYGLDLYSLFTSIEAVLKYLDEHDPEEARRARARYACFDHAKGDSQAYGYGASYGASPSCEDEVVQQLRDLVLA